jgi:methyl-accepting chemotaxis protein
MYNDNKRQFKNYLINKDLQLRVVLNTIIYMLLVILLTAGVVFSPLVGKMLFSDDIETQYRMAQTYLILVKWLLPAIILIVVLFVIHHIIVTHRICGPLVNFAHTFKKMGQGDLTRKVYIRHRDYLKKECSEINGMIDGLSKLLSQVSRDQKNLIDEMEGLMANIESLDTPEKIRTSLTVIDGKARVVSDRLALFTFEEENEIPEA